MSPKYNRRTIRPISPDFPNVGTYAEIQYVLIDGERWYRHPSHWSKLRNEMLRRCMKECKGNFERLRQACQGSVRIAQGRSTKAGYTYLGDIRISVASQSANSACQTIATLAESMKIDIVITCRWTDRRSPAGYYGKEGWLILCW